MDKAARTEAASYTIGDKACPPRHTSAGFLESEGSCENQRSFLEGDEIDLGLEGWQRFEQT